MKAGDSTKKTGGGGEEMCCEGGVVKRSSHHSVLHHQKLNGVYGSWTSTAKPDQGCCATQRKKPEKRSHRDKKKKETNKVTRTNSGTKRKTRKLTHANKHLVGSGVWVSFSSLFSLPATGDRAYTDYYADMESKTGFANEGSWTRKLDRDIEREKEHSQEMMYETHNMEQRLDRKGLFGG